MSKKKKKAQNKKNISKHQNISKKKPLVNYGIIPKITNIVSTAYLGCKLDLNKIASHYKEAKLSERFDRITLKINNPKTTAFICSNGKLICLGAKSEEDSLKACKEYCNIIKNLNFGVKFSGFEIQNIVGSYDVKFKIPLSDLRKNILIKNHCNYEPEIFPGLIYHPECEANITLTVFSSGKIIISGGKKTQQIYDELNKFYPFLIKYNN